MLRRCSRKYRTVQNSGVVEKLLKKNKVEECVVELGEPELSDIKTYYKLIENKTL
jgi:hypothetical protein